MAFEEERPEEVEVQVKKKSPMRLIVTLGVIVVLLGGLGGGGFYGYKKFFVRDAAKSAKGEAGGREEKPEKSGKVEPAVIHEWEPFLVNLTDPGGKRYLKLTMRIELTGHEAEVDFVAKNVQLRDSVLLLLSSKSFDDIAGTKGKTVLKQEIIAQANRILQHGQVKDVYFIEFLIQ